MSTVPTSFTSAVTAIPSIRNHLKPGLQALSRGERSRVFIAEPRSLAGSVDIDRALRKSAPTDPRWDHVVGVRRPSGADFATFIEFHPANTASVRDMVAKAVWLRKWLRSDAVPLLRLSHGRPKLVWVSTGKVGLRRGSNAERQLAQVGIRFPVSRVELS